MSRDPVQAGAFCPRGAAPHSNGTTPAAVVLGYGSGGEPIYRTGTLNPLDHVWDDVVRVMSHRLQAGSQASTPVASGELADVDGETREVDGVTTDLLRVVPWRRDDPLGSAPATGTQTRPAPSSSTSAPIPRKPVGTFALDVTARRGLVLTDDGPGLLGGVLTSGSAPSSNRSRPTRPVGPAAVRVGARFATWPGRESVLVGPGTRPKPESSQHSIPIRFVWPGMGGLDAGLADQVVGQNITGSNFIFGRPVHVWGAMRPYHVGRRQLIPPGTRDDPDSLDSILYRRWAPCMEFDANAIYFKFDEPPKKKDGKPPPFNPPPFPPFPPWPPQPQPPPGGGGPGGDQPDGKQKRNPFEDPDKPRGQPAGDGGNGGEVGFVPGQDTWVPGTGLPNPGQSMDDEAGLDDGKAIKGCPLGETSGLQWFPQSDGTGVIVGTGPGADIDVTNTGSIGLPVPEFTPGQLAALELEDGSRIKITTPSLASLSPQDQRAMADMVLNPGIARVPSPFSTIGQQLSPAAIAALTVRQLNGLTDIVQAALVGGRYSHYEGNLGIVNTNRGSLGVSDQFIGQHLVDPPSGPRKVIPPSLHIFQAITSKRRSVRVRSPAFFVDRTFVGNVSTDQPLIGVRKVPHRGARDTGSFIADVGDDRMFDITTAGRGHFAGGLQALELDPADLLAAEVGTRRLIAGNDGQWYDVDDEGTVSAFGGASSLNGLTDVDTSGASLGDVLTFDGATWGPAPAGGGLTSPVGIADGGTGATTAAGARTALGLAIGTNVQAYSARLADVAALAVTADNFVVANGSNLVLKTPSQARTSLQLVPGTDVQAFPILETDLPIEALVQDDIGTLVQAQSPLLDDVAGLTLAEGDVLFYDGANLVNLGPGTDGDVLTTHGAGASPTWETPTGGSGDPDSLWGNGGLGDLNYSIDTDSGGEINAEDLTIAAGKGLRAVGNLKILCTGAITLGAGATINANGRGQVGVAGGQGGNSNSAGGTAGNAGNGTASNTTSLLPLGSATASGRAGGGGSGARSGAGTSGSGGTGGTGRSRDAKVGGTGSGSGASGGASRVSDLAGANGSNAASVLVQDSDTRTGLESWRGEQLIGMFLGHGAGPGGGGGGGAACNTGTSGSTGNGGTPGAQTGTGAGHGGDGDNGGNNTGSGGTGGGGAGGAGGGLLVIHAKGGIYGEVGVDAITAWGGDGGDGGNGGTGVAGGGAGGGGAGGAGGVVVVLVGGPSFTFYEPNFPSADGGVGGQGGTGGVGSSFSGGDGGDGSNGEDGYAVMKQAIP